MDVSPLVEEPRLKFNLAVIWVVGALAVLLLIAWIVRAMRHSSEEGREEWGRRRWGKS